MMISDQPNKVQKVKLDPERQVPFVVNLRPAPGTVALHSGEKGDNAVHMGLGALRKEVWERVSDIMEVIGGEVRELRSNFVLDEITVSLGLSAKGQVAFVAEASGQAIFQVKLKRKTK
jgi:hypothetical protein